MVLLYVVLVVIDFDKTKREKLTRRFLLLIYSATYCESGLSIAEFGCRIKPCDSISNELSSWRMCHIMADLCWTLSSQGLIFYMKGALNISHANSELEINEQNMANETHPIYFSLQFFVLLFYRLSGFLLEFALRGLVRTRAASFICAVLFLGLHYWHIRESMLYNSIYYALFSKVPCLFFQLRSCTRMALRQ